MGWDINGEYHDEENLDVVKKTTGNKLEGMLREIQTLPEPRRFAEMLFYIRRLEQIKDDTEYYSEVGKRLYRRMYGVEYREK